MSDIYTLRFENFRSLQNVSIDLAPLTVVYGPNGAGKSSVMYGLLTLKNFLTNPNQNIPSLFSYPSVSLGGLNEVVHGHKASGALAISFQASTSKDIASTFTLGISASGGASIMLFDTTAAEDIRHWPDALALPVALPYAGNQTTEASFEVLNWRGDGSPSIPGMVAWNGLFLSATPEQATPLDAPAVERLNRRINLPVEMVRQTGFVPLRRGFSKPVYGFLNAPGNLWTEDEVAGLLASSDERYRQYDVSRYMEQITGKRFQAHSLHGSPIFTIDSVPVDSKGGVPVSIVNEGFGINQLLYMLTVCLHTPYRIVAVEEPEIHLHPSMIRKLAVAMAQIATKEDRHLVVSTHSEAFVVALLTHIAKGQIDADDVSFVMAENQQGETSLTQRKARENGQIEGGLEAFMAAELEDIAAFLDVG